MQHLTMTDQQLADAEAIKFDPTWAWLYAVITAGHYTDDRGAILITLGNDTSFADALGGLSGNVDLHLANGDIQKVRVVGWSRTDDAERWEALEVLDVNENYELIGQPARRIDVALIDRIEY